MNKRTGDVAKCKQICQEACKQSVLEQIREQPGTRMDILSKNSQTIIIGRGQRLDHEIKPQETALVWNVLKGASSIS